MLAFFSAVGRSIARLMLIVMFALFFFILFIAACAVVLGLVALAVPIVGAFLFVFLVILLCSSVAVIVLDVL